VEALEDACLLPIAEAAPAGHTRPVAKLLRQPLPGDPGREHKQDPAEHLSIVEPFAAGMPASPLRLGQQRRDQVPQCVIDHR
jgi:hypothetical protein